MAISLASLKTGAVQKPPRIIAYGPHGVGKTTFAAQTPAPVFIQTEDGLGEMDAPHFDLATTYAEVIEALTALCAEDHNFQTVCLDSLDWLERLIWSEVCRTQGVKTIEDIGYGKGYVMALDFWREYMTAINYLRSEKQMTIFQTAHAEVKRFDDPSTDPYDRYQIKLHKAASALVQEHADIVLFCNYKVSTTKSDTGFGNKRTRAVGSGERVCYTQEKPSFLAKNRYSMPAELPMDWLSVAANISFFNQSGATENGVS